MTHSSHKSAFLEAAKTAFKIHCSKTALLPRWKNCFPTAAPYSAQLSLPRFDKTNREVGAEREGNDERKLCCKLDTKWF